MDFSKLIDKKIQQKQKPQSRWNRQRNKAATAANTPDQTSTNPKTDISNQEHSGENEPKTENKLTVKGANEDVSIDYTAEEIALADELSLDDVNSKLASFNELENEPNIPKVEKIRKLGILLHKQQKDRVYQDQLDKEDKVPMNLDIQEIGNIEFQAKHYTQLRKYIKYIIKCWESQISIEEDIEQSSASGGGKASSTSSSSSSSSFKLLIETKRDVVPLLYKLRKENLPLSMFTSLTTVIYYLQSENYRMANETYLKLSIGNAAWPVGVRSVGIHQRAADSKITGNNKKTATNIMMGDKTRRWITAVKRLITFCEKTAKITSV
ncbi:pre-mRNA-splicing factor 18 [[Candida] railenensis]|uniref:Pre-mRNA-splicing factor 18 n=1 Tax=[Candida] railenensis TaxID=45579 RepID=A0A9P0QU24_9ASCO|nr:pre-mRNA-splicing factor 18 [[Candida] railenensis]